MDGETKHALQCRTAVEYAKAIVQRFLHYPGLTFISGICQLSCGQHQSRTKADIKSVTLKHVSTSDLQDRNGEVMHKIKKMRLNQKGENCKKNKKLLAEANFCQRRQRNLDVYVRFKKKCRNPRLPIKVSKSKINLKCIGNSKQMQMQMQTLLAFAAANKKNTRNSHVACTSIRGHTPPFAAVQ